MKNIKKKTFVILLTIIMTISNMNTFAEATVLKTEEENLSGPGIGPIHLLGVTGDSYSGFLSDYLEETYQIRPRNYTNPGTTIEENYDTIVNCIKDKKYPYIILSIGVNDHWRGTDPAVFKKTIKSFIELAKKENKHLFYHTYMKYGSHQKYNKRYTCKQYDYALQDLALLYKNVDYINMADINEDSCQNPDGIHYNDKFYKILIDRINPKILKLFNQVK